MKIEVKPGKYVLAVSGGVDSMVLLDILAKKPGIEVVVAHFNHNMRPDSAADQELVKKSAKQRGLVFVSAKAGRGKLSSENDARKARYDFFNLIKKKYGARAIITAHHQDDKLETAIINIIRGTGRRGLSAISDNKQVVRPLLGISKSEIIGYAKSNQIKWNEDSTNSSPEYLRNYLRLKIIPKLDDRSKENLITKIDKVAITNKHIDKLIATMSQMIYNNHQINRGVFSNLPSEIGHELLVSWLKDEGTWEYDRKTVERLSLAIKTAKTGSTHPIKDSQFMDLSEQYAHFSNTL